MKLKKIASLMLAGVMAVSMLAGCSTAVDPEPTPNPDPTPSANYGTTFYSYLSSDAQKKMTFGSNADLDAALKTAVERAGSLSIATNYWLADTVVEINTDGLKLDASTNDVEKEPTVIDSLYRVAKNLSESTGAENEELHVRADDWTGMEAVLNQINKGVENKNADDVNAVALYVVDSTVSVEAALDDIADDLDNIIKNLDIIGHVENSKGEYEYKYTGSVSVTSKSIPNVDGMSVNFIAVEIARTTVQR